MEHVWRRWSGREAFELTGLREDREPVRYAPVLEIPHPIERLRRSAGWLTALYSTDFDVVRVLDAATDEDAETRHLVAAKLRGRNRVMDQLIASVELQLTVSLPDAQAVFRAYAAAGVYGALVIDAGWPPERFEVWLAASGPTPRGENIGTTPAHTIFIEVKGDAAGVVDDHVVGPST